MLLSEMGEKELIDLTKGTRHGTFWDAEMLFDEKSGAIKALLVPSFQGKRKYVSPHDTFQLPWESIIKIGLDIIIFKS